MLFLRAPIIGIAALHDLRRTEQPVGFDDGAFPMHPLGLNGMQPGALTRQATHQDAHPLSRLLHLVVVLPPPGPDLVADVPRGVIPDQEAGAYPLGRSPCAAPGEKRGRLGAAGAPLHTAQEHLCGLLGDMAHHQAITGQGLGGVLVARRRAFLQAARRAIGGPGVERGLGDPTPPHLIAPAQGPGRMGGGQGDQSVAPFFFRTYAGSGLGSQGLARCQRPPRRVSARRMVAPLTCRAVRPSA